MLIHCVGHGGCANVARRTTAHAGGVPAFRGQERVPTRDTPYKGNCGRDARDPRSKPGERHHPALRTPLHRRGICDGGQTRRFAPYNGQCGRDASASKVKGGGPQGTHPTKANAGGVPAYDRQVCSCITEQQGLIGTNMFLSAHGALTLEWTTK